MSLATLDRIRVVLVEPTHPGNIGAVARALKTMGLTRLVLVNPKKFPHCEASQRAAGAESVLEAAIVVDSIDQAIADCTLVFGTSVRDREVSWPTIDPREAAAKVGSHCLQENTQVAILFGRESSGLRNSEMDLCQAQIRISANQEYSSLNLASAVQIIAYEQRMQCVYGLTSPAKHESPLTGAVNRESLAASDKTGAQVRQKAATEQQRIGHIEHLQKTLESLNFTKAKPPTMLMRKLVRLYNKAELTVEEIQILRGILSAVDSQLGQTEE